MTEHEQAVLDEQALSDARIVAECDCRSMTLVDRVGSGLDDHATDYLICQQCGAGEVITTWATRNESDVRPMTASEWERYSR